MSITKETLIYVTLFEQLWTVKKIFRDTNMPVVLIEHTTDESNIEIKKED